MGKPNCLGCGFLAWVTSIEAPITTVLWACLKCGGPQQFALRNPLLRGDVPERMSPLCYEKE